MKYLLLLQDLKLFEYHKKHRESLVNSIKNHNKYRSHKYLTKLKINFDINNICNISNKNKTTCYNWIRKMIGQNLIIKNKVNDWSLSPQGIKIREVLKLVGNNQLI